MVAVSLKKFFQAEDGIRDRLRSRGLGDVYKRQALDCTIRRNDKLSEGIVEIVVCDHHEEEIKEESVRILTVSLI